MMEKIYQITATFSYPIVVTLIFISVYFFFRYKIHRIERKSLKSVKKRSISDAVETDSPLDDQERTLKEKGISGIEGRFSFIRSAFPLVLITFWIVVVIIPYLGKIPSVYVSIIAAAFSVVIGVSLRPFLENLFSGVVISFFKSLRIGDTVIIDDNYGLIEQIGLTHSILKRWDWNRIVIPNSKILQKEIQSLTMNDKFIWAYVEFFVSPTCDVDQIKDLSLKAAKDSKYFNQAEDPSFWVMGLEKDSIKCWLAAWADNPSDAWELRHDLRVNLLKEFQKADINLHQIVLKH